MSIPAKHRKVLGVEAGGLLVADIEDGVLRLRAVRDVVASLQAKVRQYIPAGKSLVDELIAERRQEAAREEDG
jgi:bifunctional DNA-binding transcriptional regulator/antitoxin component of YhaV-PrlF toxin-antitoxin module